MPHLGWVGFDPTNNLVAHHRHIRTAVGRDYADVPPTHGIFRGKTASELYVAVHVEASEQPPALDRKLPIPEDWSVLVERAQQPAERPQPLDRSAADAAATVASAGTRPAAQMPHSVTIASFFIES